MQNDWLKLYYGLGAFQGLESQPTENILTIINRNAPMKAFSQKPRAPVRNGSKKLAFPKIEVKYSFDNPMPTHYYAILLFSFLGVLSV